MSNEAGYSQVHDGDTTDNVTPLPRDRAVQNVPGIYWTAARLQAYVRDVYHRELDDITAGNQIKSLGGNKRLDSAVGKPYIANNRKAKGWADKLYGSGNGDAAPTGTGER